MVAPSTAPGASDATSDATPLPTEQTAPAAAGETTTNPAAAPTAVAAASDTASDAPALPSVIGAGTDATFPAAALPPPGDDSPGVALLIGGMTVLLLIAVGVVVARRGRG
jgi:hypothetical protein